MSSRESINKAAKKLTSGSKKKLEEFVNNSSIIELIDKYGNFLPPNQINEIQKQMKEFHKESSTWIRRNYRLALIIGIIGGIEAVGNFYESHELWKKIPPHLGIALANTALAPVSPSIREWEHQTRIDAFDGRYTSSKVLETKKNGWMTVRIYEDGGRREMILGGFTRYICADRDVLEIQVKSNNEVHNRVTAEVSKDKTSLSLEEADRWITRINKYGRLVVRIEDDCGERDDLVFNTKGKINLAF